MTKLTILFFVFITSNEIFALIKSKQSSFNTNKGANPYKRSEE